MQKQCVWLGDRRIEALDARSCSKHLMSCDIDRANNDLRLVANVSRSRGMQPQMGRIVGLQP